MSNDDEIPSFRKSIHSHTKVTWTGSSLAVLLAILGLLLAMLNLIGVQPVLPPEFTPSPATFALAAALVLALTYLWAVYQAAREHYRGRLRLAEKLTPCLEICADLPMSTGTHQRIKVHNKAERTIRFSTKILSIEPSLARYDKIPNFLQIDDSDHPHHKEANIQGGGDALVNVIAWIGTETFPNAGTPAYALLIASPLIMNNPSAGAITLPTGHYKILVQAFPVDPQGPASEPREFYIVPQSDGHMLLSTTKPPHTLHTTEQPESQSQGQAKLCPSG